MTGDARIHPLQHPDEIDDPLTALPAPATDPGLMSVGDDDGGHPARDE